MMSLRIRIAGFSEHYEQLIRQIYEAVFFLYVGIYAFESFSSMTFFSFPLILFSILDTVGMICRCLIGFLLVISFVASVFHLCPEEHFLKWDLKTFLYTAVCTLILAVVGIYGPNYMLCLNRLPLLMAGAHKIDFRKITAVYFAVTASFIAASVLCSCTGIITNLDYPIKRLGLSLHRYALGTNYPTDFCAHVFFCLCCYAYTRGERIRKWEIGMLAAVTLLSFAVTISYTSFSCNVLLLVCVIYTRQRRKKRKDFCLKKGTRIICTVIYPVLAVFMIGMSRFYNGNSSFWEFMDSLFHNRLRLGNLAFERYDIPLLTQYVEQNGYGGRTTYPDGYEYFYLDSSYVNILFRLGIIVLICVLAVFVIIQLRMTAGNNALGMLIIAVIAVQCVMEHHLIEYFFHPFLLALAADTAWHDDSVFVSERGRRQVRGNKE